MNSENRPDQYTVDQRFRRRFIMGGAALLFGGLQLHRLGLPSETEQLIEATVFMIGGSGVILPSIRSFQEYRLRKNPPESGDGWWRDSPPEGPPESPDGPSGDSLDWIEDVECYANDSQLQNV